MRAREGEREEQRPLACTIQKKRRNKIRNLWLWLVCCSLLPTCNVHHRPFTYIYIYIYTNNPDVNTEVSVSDLCISDHCPISWRLGAFCVHHTTCTMSRHFMQSHVRRVHVCIFSYIACQLHFWQNDQNLSPATAQHRGWNGYLNKSSRGVEPTTFRSRVRRSDH